MTSPEQAMAARLTAIAKKCERNSDSLLVFGNDYSDVLLDAALVMREASAHVETLTQQVAHWKKLGDSVASEDAQLQALAAELGVPLPEDRQGYTGKHTMFSVIRWLQQENARLTAALNEMAKSLGLTQSVIDSLKRVKSVQCICFGPGPNPDCPAHPNGW